MTHNIEILYGSTTGNTQELAETIALKLQNPQANITCTSVLEITGKHLLKANTNIWCCSTWGIEPACLQEDFENFINNNLQTNTIQGGNFMVFALGDNHYPHFAAAADILQEIIVKNKGNLLFVPLKIQDPWDLHINEIDTMLINFGSKYFN